MNTPPLRVAIRALILPPGPLKPPKPGKELDHVPEVVLVFDTETSIGPSQRLLFGVYRFGIRQQDGTLVCQEEGIFYENDLKSWRPEEFAVLCAYIEGHRSLSAGEGTLRVMSQRNFIDQRLWPAIEQGALIVGFNLPFDMARIAGGAGEARGQMFEGGFSLPLFYWQGRSGVWHEKNFYRPRFRSKTIDKKRSVMGWGMPKKPSGPRIALPAGPGPLLDLKALGFALTDQGHSLKSLAKAFGLPITKRKTERHGTITPEYIDYGRQDVAVSWQLLESMLDEWGHHPIRVAPMRALSPAALGKGYLRAMGITPPLIKWDHLTALDLAPWMNSYCGGRAECRVRRTPVPVVYADFRSMYPTVNVLLGLWNLVIAERVEFRDATERVKALLQAVQLDWCLDPAHWAELRFVARIRPDGDILPVRAQYDPASPVPNIGLNPLIAPDREIWAAGPDLVASVLLSGKVPEILEARELVGKGVQSGLRPTRLRGEVPIDPRKQDFFRALVEARARLKNDAKGKNSTDRSWLERSLKVTANSVGYGISAELNRQPRSKDPVPVTVYGGEGPFPSRTSALEEMGEFFFPPFAALVTAGARLKLAILERLVTDAGGTIAFGDTDSAAIVASARGGRVPCGGPNGATSIQALSWRQVRERIVAPFARLNPYDREIIPGSLLKIEGVNFDPKSGRQREIWAFAISAKRYALFRPSSAGPTVEVAKEHGLGHLYSPVEDDGDGGEIERDKERGRPWIRAVWEALIHHASSGRWKLPRWVDRPALTQMSVTRWEFLKAFQAINSGRAYPDQIKPMNFGWSVQVAQNGHPVGVDPTQFHLLAPFERDPQKWLMLPWYDKYTGKEYRIGIGLAVPPSMARVRTVRDVIEEYATHPEPKSLGPDGRPCDRQTVGLLGRRPVEIAELVYIGKEANRLEEAEGGMVTDVDEVLDVHHQPTDTSWWRIVVPVLRAKPPGRLACGAPCSARYLRYLLKGARQPSDQLRLALWRQARRWSLAVLRRRSTPGAMRKAARQLVGLGRVPFHTEGIGAKSRKRGRRTR
jgi:hypothetical protein